ncbi:hypothetical protein SDC9_176998 [bioreactor metagenome]|uniref:Uncharacterized protein n=1 Tax=bioreactor metagenome TaxID=1076179 RepID=A0A645GS25_9ZZZZ
MVGDIIGIVIRKKRWTALAPSMEAASWISSPTPCRPERYIIMVWPMPQIPMMIRPYSEVVGLFSQPGPLTPSIARPWLSRPCSRSICAQIMEEAMTGMMDGRKKIIRKAFMKRMRMLSMRATSRLSTWYSGIETRQKLKVTSSALMNLRSEKSLV